MDYRTQIGKALEKIIGIDNSIINKLLENTKISNNGDFTLPLFKLDNFNEINLKEIENSVNRVIDTRVIEAKLKNKVYLNFYINNNIIFNESINKVFKNQYIEKVKQKEVILIENISLKICDNITEDNIACALIGQVLYNIYIAKGYKVIFINNIDDITKEYSRYEANSDRFSKVHNIYSEFNIVFNKERIKSKYYNKENVVYKKELIKKINGFEVIDLNKYNMSPYNINDLDNRLELEMLIDKGINRNKYRCIFISPQNNKTIMKKRIKVLELLDIDVSKLYLYESLKFKEENIFRVLNEDISVEKLLNHPDFKRSKLINTKERIIESVKYIIITKSNSKNNYISYEDIFSENIGTIGYIIKTKFKIDNILEEYREEKKIKSIVRDDNVIMYNINRIEKINSYSKILDNVIKNYHIGELNNYLYQLINIVNSITIKKHINNDEILLIRAIDAIIISILENMGLRISLWL